MRDITERGLKLYYILFRLYNPMAWRDDTSLKWNFAIQTGTRGHEKIEIAFSNFIVRIEYCPGKNSGRALFFKHLFFLFLFIHSFFFFFFFWKIHRLINLQDELCDFSPSTKKKKEKQKFFFQKSHVLIIYQYIYKTQTLVPWTFSHKRKSSSSGNFFFLFLLVNGM